jgi:pimeloyl-ACP methyl ester carboxylesterase
VRKFADALGIKQFHLSGNSMGCVHAYQFLLCHPERVLSVAFIAGHLGDIVETPYVRTGESKFASNPDYVTPPYDGTHQSMKTLMEGIIYEPRAIWPELIEMRVLAANMQRKARKDLEIERPFFTPNPNVPPNMLQLTQSKGRIDKLTTPMICLYGLQDVSVPVENGFAQDDGIPNIQYFFPDECGHQGQTDQPEMFNQAFLEFFRDGKVSWKTAVWAGVSRRKPINPNLVEEPAGGFPAADKSIYDSLEKLREANKTLIA